MTKIGRLVRQESDFNQGVKAGWGDAWNEALTLVKSATATVYLTAGDTYEAQNLRTLCHRMMDASSRNPSQPVQP